MENEDPNSGGRLSMIRKMKPYLAMVFLQFGYAGMYIITMVSFKHGLSHWVLSVYRHIVATLIMAPFALVLERYLSSCLLFKASDNILIYALFFRTSFCTYFIIMY
ncbi:hypothetical protein Lalb_Chr00c21g0406211 (mitochondrion) [Lupinus albus]|uniref:WAT1-related protein n=1 Tax=Lupinus albus TaxID=3870 RepID=A0A6A4N119_LUPAL|nr:hypothetical protein Lalb_Chr00c21g0406211 [Lupinus albus]